MSFEAIRPKKFGKVMDIVSQAGLDVSDWGNYAKGPSHAAANPRYCYNWSFHEAGVGVVLNLWFDNMRFEEGRILHSVNYRREAEENRASGAKAQWVQRGLALDAALQAALRENIPIHVIVNAGERQEHGDPERLASSVTNRALDDRTWTITKYNWRTGECTLTRGLHSAAVE